MSKKRLYLMRHGKSEAAHGSKDYQRHLSKQGRDDVHRQAEKLIELDQKPGQIIVSSALRAIETAEELERVLGRGTATIEYNEQLYLAQAADYLEIISQTAREAVVLVVAHNPSMEQLAAHFEGSGAGMGTSEIAWFDFELSCWKDLDANSRPQECGRLIK